MKQRKATASRGIRALARRYNRNKGAVFGFAFLLVLSALAIFADTIAPHDPMDAGIGPRLEHPGRSFLMGTDNLGRDIFSGVLHGSRISLLIGLSAALTAVTIGTVVGAVSGYLGGWVDDLLMRGCEVFQTMPRFLFALVIVVFFGSSIWNVVVVIGLLGWPQTARMVRSEFLHLRESELVLSARALGVGHLRIIFVHLLRNVFHIIVVTGTLEIGTAIITEAGLSYLGAGDPNMVSWGRMLYDSQRFLRDAWWFSVFPGMAVFLTVLSWNLLGDGLNDALNPRMMRNM